MPEIQNYSQRDEQAVILAIFAGRTDGLFLDIGAADGLTFSNTRALYELGWHGVMVDASPHAVVALINRYADNNRVLIVDAAVVDGAPIAPLMQFHTSPDLVSSLSSQHRELWKSHAKFVTIAKPVVPLSDVLDFTKAFCGIARSTSDVRIDLINIDVEGHSLSLLRALPPGECGAAVIVVEYDDALEVIKAWAATRGFDVAHVTAENVILRRRA